jgi:hypothetical protein
MEKIVFELLDHEHEKLNTDYPPEKGSALIGNRAEAIVKLYFFRKDVNCRFVIPEKGADLKVEYSNDEPSVTLEVKGTEDTDIAFQKLRVSSEDSMRVLSEKRIPLYRVTDVFGRKPVIHILFYGADFDLTPEPRWRVNPITTKREDHEEDNTGSIASSASSELTTSADSSSKYIALTEYLNAQDGSEVTLQFTRAQEILGFPLPPSAMRYQAFWANQSDTTNRPQARAWQDAGFSVDSYRLSEVDGWVRFKRDN